MKKTFKKTAAIILTVLMLISAVPLQSFAALSLVNPEIKSVKFNEGVMISMKEIEKLHDYYNEDTIVLQNDSGSYPYPMLGTGFYYDNLLISFSNGKTVELDRLFDDMPEVTGYSGPSFKVSYSDCKKAIENGDSTVPVNVQLSISFERGKNKRFEDDVECKIVESYIKSIKPTEKLNPYYEKMYYWDYFVGQKMIVEYEDGTSKTLEITEGEYAGWIGILRLDGRPLTAHIDEVVTDYDKNGDEIIEKVIEFIYCDATYEEALEVIDCPYRKIEITDYKIAENNVLTSITYKITKTNGETETYTNECNITDRTDAVTIDKIGAYRVDVDLNIDIASFKENSVGDVQIFLGEGYNEEDCKLFDYKEYDASNYCNCICHKNGVAKLIYSMLIKIWDLFGINEQCKCGAWHWDE